MSNDEARSAIDAAHKECLACGEQRPVSSFNRDLNAPDHMHCVCMTCEPLSLHDLLIRARQTTVSRVTATLAQHRSGRRPATAELRRDALMARYRAAGGKRCTTCWHRKPPTLEHWHANQGKPDGLQTTCRQCILLQGKLPGATWQAARAALRSNGGEPPGQALAGAAQSGGITAGDQAIVDQGGLA